MGPGGGEREVDEPADQRVGLALVPAERDLRAVQAGDGQAADDRALVESRLTAVTFSCDRRADRAGVAGTVGGRLGVAGACSASRGT